ncbi:hypothetical protein A3H53_01325 [Candidatus Nomurabacteria bacterium RIFCSPLOWO2_02_FULL_40_10]|uniref:Uncharacterized protein n=1 Tax=Candidatus Nomurabacteria bacterium RIFCSPLOWO2_02_FULL_40_10 TaxID=1801786 RepID=A0A1F6XWX7_9BACT|nr:MAG: hypothetical protein A3H53_01325 [Candidatus Nomurabacteria bacterium RIFCSPLOWO2_02_FULL_40_10]
MKNFIWWRVLLYLILVLEIIFLWWAISSLIKTYEGTIDSLTASQSCVCRCDNSEVENKVSKPAPKPKPAPAPVYSPTPPPASNPGPLPPNGPGVYNPPQSTGGLPPN